MAGKYNRVSFLLVVACLALLKISSAKTVYIVGDSTGWTIPSSSSFYSTWASSKTFKAGDVLEFHFLTGQHTVAEVSKSAYDACNTGSHISLASSGPANLTISSSGTHYYICTVDQHCSRGQKLTITATGTAAAPSPAPTPTTPASPPKAPAPSPKAPAPSPKTASPAPSPKAPAPSPKAPAPSPKTPEAAPAPSPTPTTTTTPTPTPTPPPSTVPSPSVPSTPSPAGGSSPTSAPPSPSAAPAGAVASLIFSCFSIVAAAFLY